MAKWSRERIRGYHEIHEVLDAYFPGQPTEMVIEEDYTGNTNTAWVHVLTDLEVDDVIKKLDAFDNGWWLSNSRRLKGMAVYVRFIDNSLPPPVASHYTDVSQLAQWRKENT